MPLKPIKLTTTGGALLGQGALYLVKAVLDHTGAATAVIHPNGSGSDDLITLRLSGTLTANPEWSAPYEDARIQCRDLYYNLSAGTLYLFVER